MKSYVVKPGNKAAMSAVKKLIAADSCNAPAVLMTKVELKAYMEDVTILNTVKRGHMINTYV